MNSTTGVQRRETLRRSAPSAGEAPSGPHTARSTRRRPGPKREAFSLVDVLVGTALIGLGLVALLVASAAGTRTSDGCRKLTEAVFLAQEIREWTLKLPFSDPQTPGAEPGLDSGESLDSVDDLDDLMNVTCSPPRDGQGSPLADMVGWSETITLTWRDPADLQSPVAPGSSDIVYVQVDLSYQGRPELVTGWLVTRKNP